MNEHKQTIDQIQVTPQYLVDLLALVDKKTISNNTAKEVLAEMFVNGKQATTIVEEKGLAQISNEATIAPIVAQIISENEDQVAAYLSGKEKLRGWFVGQVMRQTRGKANPELVNKIVAEQLRRYHK
jgi:aspartyl-tRNA(Asn)/glutamyl-tRNA(Gln) amidotransferase subunit B